jgi:hypothetical protein
MISQNMVARVESKTVFPFTRKAKIKRKLSSFREISFQENVRVRESLCTLYYMYATTAMYFYTL